MPVAVNCLLVPAAMIGLTGSTAMERSLAEVTVKFVVPETPPEVAVIVVVPAEREEANPFEPGPKVATEGADELQVTEELRSLLE